MAQSTSSPSRRSILRSAASVAVAASGAAAAPNAPLLPTIKLGDYNVTRLICGCNPFYGFAHFNLLFSLHMKEWMTQERVCEVLRQCESNGINTWQLGYRERMVSDLRRHRAEGGKLQIIILSHPVLHENLGDVAAAASLKPIGIVHHGGVTDSKFRSGRKNEVREYLKSVRDTGVMVGLSTHNPAVIEYVEDNDWDIDFYMTCFYWVTRTREQITRLLGEAPLGELFLEKDPERMTRVVRQTRKPCLGFKILAAGRRTDQPAQVAEAFNFALANIKSRDGIIVGMYPRFNKDEARDNANHVRRIHSALT